MIPQYLLLLALFSAQTISAAFNRVSSREKQNNGILHLGGCSSSLIRTWSSDLLPSTPAYLLTAGHCVGGFDNVNRGKILLNHPAPSSDKNLEIVSHDYFDNDGMSTSSNNIQISVAKISFATMNLTDLAIIELNINAIELLKQGYPFYNINTQVPSSNTPGKQIGFPNRQTMHSSELTIGSQTVYKESWGHEIEFGISVNGPNARGFSGSPVFSEYDNTIIGVTSQVVHDSFGYMQRVDYVRECFGDDGVFQLLRPGCLAPYKLRLYERFGIALPGFKVDTPSNDNQHNAIIDTEKPAQNENNNNNNNSNKNSRENIENKENIAPHIVAVAPSSRSFGEKLEEVDKKVAILVPAINARPNGQIPNNNIVNATSSNSAGDERQNLFPAFILVLCGVFMSFF